MSEDFPQRWPEYDRLPAAARVDSQGMVRVFRAELFTDPPGPRLPRVLSNPDPDDPDPDDPDPDDREPDLVMTRREMDELVIGWLTGPPGPPGPAGMTGPAGER